jgi:hypothetical protein
VPELVQMAHGERRALAVLRHDVAGARPLEVGVDAMYGRDDAASFTISRSPSKPITIAPSTPWCAARRKYKCVPPNPFPGSSLAKSSRS